MKKREIREYVDAAIANFGERRRRYRFQGRQLPLEEWNAWVDDHICDLADSLWSIPTFREYAAWPLSAYTDPGVPEQRTIERFVHEARQCSIQLRKVIDRRNLSAALAGRIPVGDDLLSEVRSLPPDRRCKVEAAGWSNGGPGRDLALVAELGENDLVDPRDYLVPRFGADCGKRETVEHNWPLLDASDLIRPDEIPVLGDLVGTSLRCRAKAVWSCLLRYYRETLLVISKVSRVHKEILALRRRWSDFDSAYSALVEIVRNGEHRRIVRATASLVQLDVAYCERSDLEWLNLKSRGVSTDRRLLRDLLDRQVLVAGWQQSVVLSLRSLRLLATSPSLATAQRDQAIREGKLVIDPTRHAYYWSGRPIDFGKSQLSEEFLGLLARKATVRQGVSAIDLFGAAPSGRSTFPTAKNRLTKMLPEDLSKRIRQMPHLSRYVLDLDPDRIFVIPRKS